MVMDECTLLAESALGHDWFLLPHYVQVHVWYGIWTPLFLEIHKHS